MKEKALHMLRFMHIESKILFIKIRLCKFSVKNNLLKKIRVALVGVQPENDVIKLNAGPGYIMKANDICFYMSITKEENSSLQIAASAHQNIPDEDLTLTEQLTRKLSFRRSSFSIAKPGQNLLNIAQTPSENQAILKCN